jgi:hypothetical protein
MRRPDEAGRQAHHIGRPLTAVELQENTTMATEESALAPESRKMIDLRHQLREASTPEAQRDVMVKTILAGRNKEISVAESKVISMEFARINAEAQARLKEERARLKARRTAD